MDIQSEYKKAFSLIENWRYKFDLDTVVRLFVADWAYQCTGVYKPSDKIADTQEFLEVAKPLSHIMANLLHHGVSDPLSVLLSEYCKSDAKHLGFHPTPPEVGKLIAGLLGNEFDANKALSLYEPCVGSAGIILEKIEQIFNEHLHLAEPLGNVSITVEDVNPTVLHAFCIQIIFKINYLSRTTKKVAEPRRIEVNQIDVLSRKQGLVQYIFTRH